MEQRNCNNTQILHVIKQQREPNC